MISQIVNRFPTLSAASLYAMAVLLAFNRIFAGQVLLPQGSDQLDGYPPRLAAAEYFKEFGSIPEWSPWLFGGFPFVANTGFGDTFFPTALLRLLLPVDQGMAVGMMLFIFLAGVFAFLFLRALGLNWGAAFVGGAAYMFSGMVLSLVSPGHDGKIFVSAMLPLALMFLYRGVSRGDWREYLYFGVVVGFSLLTPHFQATYYLLMASGFFWFFMVFLSGQRSESEAWWRSSLLFAGALVVGFAMAAVQLLPFMEYVPFSPRGQDSSSSGWEYAITWSMPPEELLGAFLPGFNGADIGHYFGRNNFKLHSDYIGLIVGLLALASFKLSSQRRVAWFFVFLAVYGALFAFGGHTPFYQLPYNVLPQISKTRAPSIIFFLTAFSVCTLAAFGAQYLLTRSEALAGSARHAIKEKTVWIGQIEPALLYGLGAAFLIALIAVLGGWQPLMESLSQNAGVNPPESRLNAAIANYPMFVNRMLVAVVLSGIAVVLVLPTTIRRLGTEAVGLLVGLCVLTDLFLVERSYIRYSPRAEQIVPADEVIALLKSDTSVHRTIPLGFSADESNPYSTNYFMVHGIRTALGYNGFELHAYDELLGGKNEWDNIVLPQLWKVLGVRYVVIAGPIPPQLRDNPNAAEFWRALTPVAEGLRTYEGGTATVFRVVDEPSFAYLVPQAWSVEATTEQLAAALTSPQFDPRGLLIVDKDAPFGIDTLPGMGIPINNPVRTTEPRPGHLILELERPAESDAFLYVAENHYSGWKATVDGVDADIARAQLSFMAIPVKAGAQKVELQFSLASYHTGRLISLVTLVTVLAVALVGLFKGRKAAAVRA